jgi:3-dehydroquinate synthase
MIIKSPKGFEIEIIKGEVHQRGLPEGFVITDKNVFNKHKEFVGNNGFVINAGEKTKTLDTYSEIISKIDDQNTIVAFGGGVVGDLAGFVASTYKRGIKLIQVPTTLLAMVDSSIGGKNGVNLQEKKNYVGTVYQPEKIFIDLYFLETLPAEEIRNGVAEIIKYSIMFGKPSLQRLLEKKIEPSDPDLSEIIHQCCSIKTQVIERDELDQDYRHTLNFGHTIGHALELLCNLPHGEAVAIGMVKEFELGLKLGIIKEDKLEQIKQILKINSLPTELPQNFSLAKSIELMKQDKKGSLIFAFDTDNYKVNVSEELVKETLR